jgi:hypothetical protein
LYRWACVWMLGWRDAESEWCGARYFFEMTGEVWRARYANPVNSPCHIVECANTLAFELRWYIVSIPGFSIAFDE